MEIRVLRYFLEIARERSMTRAAERLHLSQPTLTFEHLADTGADSALCFRPLEPPLETKMYIIWKKYQIFTPIAERLLEMFKSDIVKAG